MVGLLSRIETYLDAAQITPATNDQRNTHNGTHNKSSTPKCIQNMQSIIPIEENQPSSCEDGKSYLYPRLSQLNSQLDHSKSSTADHRYVIPIAQEPQEVEKNMNLINQNVNSERTEAHIILPTEKKRRIKTQSTNIKTTLSSF
ncbi:hypothetical protein JTB14_037225 [Gonioctena quinquepunctata]|nr:hypothetical protein JTB14_037225 [Gonioctena quinquepunctata]